MTTLPAIREQYRVNTVDGALRLTPGTCLVPAVAQTLAGLPGWQLTVRDPRVALDGNTLTVSGSAAERWPVGPGGRALTVTSVTLTITEPVDGGELTAGWQVEGALTLDGMTIDVAGGTDATGRIAVSAVPGAERTVPLTTLAGLVGGGSTVAGLRLLATPFDDLPLSSVRAALGIQPGQATEISVGSELVGQRWTLADGLPALQGLGIELTETGSFRGGTYQAATAGAVHATLDFDGVPIAVRLDLRVDRVWQLTLVPADGNLLPGLAALARLIGGDELADEVQAGFSWLGLSAIAVDGVRIGFDLATRSLREVVIGTHITVNGIAFAVAVTLPRFTIQGHLLPGRAIDLRELVGTFFAGADQFPAAELSDLVISADPGNRRYSLTAHVSSGGPPGIGRLPFAFTSLTMSIVTDDAGVSGGIEGTFTLFDADFHALAEHDATTGGWVFDCRTVGGTALTVKAIHDGLVELYNVDSELPAALEGLRVYQLRCSADTAAGTTEFECGARLPVGGADADVTVTIRVEPDGAGWRKSFTGTVTVGDLDFELHLVQDTASTALAASYYHTGDARRIAIHELVSALSTEVGALVPEGLTVDLRDVVLGVVDGNGFVLGLELGAKLGLSSLPLIGQEFPADRSIGVDSLRVVVASRDLTRAEVDALNALLPTAVPPLPAGASGLAGGAGVAARLNLGDALPQDLTLPMAPSTPTAPAAPTAPTAPTTPVSPGGTGTAVVPAGGASTVDSSAQWFDVQRTFGPVYIGRIGVEYADRHVRFLIDGTLSAGGLTLSLDGLTFGSSIDRFEPVFDLRGIGVDYRTPAVEIGGALLRTTVRPATGAAYDEYDGAAVIRTASFALAALGGYAYVDGHPSMFVYAVLDKALGGPPFFTVTGLAAGFGYNRRLVIPSIDEVATFPLITAATSAEPATGAANPRDLLRTKLDGLRAWIPPSTGDAFLALGVRFSSFQMVDSFALLAAAIGSRFELDLLGLSTMVAPRPDPAGPAVAPLVELQLAVRASFVPDDGVLSVRGQLTSASYLFSRDGHLTGGFAFYDWFGGDHEGDFVLTVGGYHPAFQPPDHYPQVPRLALNWQVDANLGVKADAYLALTPSAFMAGGHLQVLWQSGNLRAAFAVGVDFLIAWKPYHYDARAYLDFAVSYTYEAFGTRQINIDIGADLHVWGPDFAGTAHINLWIVSFDIAFGAQGQPGPRPIDWPEFRRSFLPDKDLCGVTVAAGLIRAADNGTGGTDLGVVDPQRLSLRVDTVIPSTAARVRGDLAVAELAVAADGNPQPFVADDANTVPAQEPGTGVRALGRVAVGPMRLVLPGHDGVHLNSTVTVTVTRDGQPAEHHFAFTPLLRNLPAALWGELDASLVPDPKGAAVVRDLLGGFELRPRHDPIDGSDRSTVDGLQLVQYQLPALPGGRYAVTVTQDVTTDEPAAVATTARRIPPQTLTRTGSFTVSGTRPRLRPDEVYAVYPPENGVGDYTRDLPHVVLAHSTLPWQESADAGREDLPWLALLLIDETEPYEPQTVTAAEARAAGAADDLPDDEKVTVIDVPVGLLPARGTDLSLLAHVRRDEAGVERAVVVGNRLPRAGSATVAHLVSVRHRYGAAGVTATGTVRLVTLKSWRFTATPAEADLMTVLTRIADGSGPLGSPVPLPHLAGDGSRTDAVYHGPFVPAADGRRPDLPARAAGDLPDDSFAAAWQLGRLLALSSRPFATALYRWKRRRAQHLRSDAAGAPPPVPVAVAAWLDDLAMLTGVPYNYLVPDPAAAPAESLRFFSVHTGWIAALLDGALSLGRSTPSDFDLDRTLAAEIAPSVSAWTAGVLVPGTHAASGVLLRSHAVAGWPDLRIDADRAPLRTLLLSPDTLLCLFDGDITGVTIGQPHHTVHFTLTDAESATASTDRVVDVTALARGRIGETAAAAGRSASFAARMLATRSTVDISR